MSNEISSTDAGSNNSAGGVVAEHPAHTIHPVLVGPTTSDRRNTIRAAIIPIACWRLDDIRFEFGSSFVKPEIAGEMTLFSKLVKDHPGAPASIFGHADPVGAEEYNKKLSGRRAAAIYGMLTRNTDIWEDIYSQTGRFTAALSDDAWGLKGVKTILQALGYSPGPLDDQMRGQTRDAVRSFQTDQGFQGRDVDGDPGPQTRARLFLAFMDKLCRDENDQPFRMATTDFLAQGIDPGGKGDYQGCGEFNPLLLFSQEENDRFEQAREHTERNTANAPNRRVLALLFRPGSKVNSERWPCPRAKEGIEGCRKRFWSDAANRLSFQAQRREYKTSRDTFGCRFYQRISAGSPCESLAPMPARSSGCVLILSDLMIDEGANAEDLYTLSATDGGFSRTLSTKDDALPGDKWVSLLFEEVPADKRYTLKARLYNDREFVLVEDVPYSDLAKVAERLTPMIDRDPDEKHEPE